jgi:DNA-binding NarL/FixJ family response regulator
MIRTIVPAHARILVADDHAVVREGLKAVFDRHADLKVVAEAADGVEAVQLVTDDIDLAILDVSMPRMTGLQAARELSRRRPGLPILMLSMYDREQYFFEAVAAGAVGYVLKQQADQDIVSACRAALRGESFIYPTALTSLMRTYLVRAARGERPGHGPLTPREADVAKLIAEGHTSQQIADLLTISPKTVERHRANLTRYAIRVGLIEP